MNKINKHAHTYSHTRKRKFKGRKWWLSVTFSTLLRQFSITSAFYMIFRTVETQQINVQQVNA